ncbi:DNA-binding transcriptional MerR regulator [Catalinimonas alkaloidigena]|uniref:MerR family transcriptional regulator n=1 Tax=Catalinimonas alkaloidigena TaxID=1075417 RepID=UPI002404EE18|nr:MerR family transcriptional regulator [Catalinimonas alkaloidigena]MDF9796876.1 DNA-binding transcriptional MerR regulator [Catalinimonas alkaloidigena]
MSNYSIRDLEQLSGIKAHTLRIWEQRYHFIEPKRTETNIRFYDDNDLKLILNIALLKDNGFKISKIAGMTEDEMLKEVFRLTEKNLRYPDQIHALTLAMIDLDEDRFEKIMATNILKLGFESTMINIIYPFLSKIGVLWQTGAISPSQEHFIANLIRQKLIVAIDGQFVSNSESQDKYLLFLPEGELHELTLLFLCYIIKARKNKVLYFGQNLPFEDLKSIYKHHKPDYILTIFTTKPPENQVDEYVEKLAKTFSTTEILLSGYQVIGKNYQSFQNVKMFTRIDHIIKFVEENSVQNLSHQ